jgi:hypothetical protein
LQVHGADRVIVTATDHDFVDVTVKTRVVSRVTAGAAKVSTGLVIAATALIGVAGVAAALPVDTVSTVTDDAPPLELAKLRFESSYSLTQAAPMLVGVVGNRRKTRRMFISDTAMFRPRKAAISPPKTSLHFARRGWLYAEMVPGSAARGG